METKTIFDIGCNNGDDADFYLRKGFNVVAVDADKGACIDVAARFSKQIAEGRCHVVYGAISEKDENVEFYVNENEISAGTNTCDPYLAEHHEKNGRGSYRKIFVPPVSVKDLIAKYGMPYYLKIDIEGSDILPLRALTDQPTLPEFTSLEIAHHDLELSVDQLSLLKKLGYSQFLFFNQGLKHLVKAPLPPKEGHYAEFDGFGHNTGLFGKELDGAWLSFDAALNRLLQIHRLHLLFRDNKRYSKDGKFGGTAWSKIYNRYRRHVLHDPVSWHDVHARAAQRAP